MWDQCDMWDQPHWQLSYRLPKAIGITYSQSHWRFIGCPCHYYQEYKLAVCSWPRVFICTVLLTLWIRSDIISDGVSLNTSSPKQHCNHHADDVFKFFNCKESFIFLFSRIMGWHWPDFCQVCNQLGWMKHHIHKFMRLYIVPCLCGHNLFVTPGVSRSHCCSLAERQLIECFLIFLSEKENMVSKK